MGIFARKAIKLSLACLLLFILTTECQERRNGRLPASTGQPYEVVLEGDTDSIVAKILTEEVTGLPQPEPLCNIISVKRGKAKGSYQMVRTRVVMDIDKRHKAFSAKTTRNENASPQLVVRIKAKSAEQLRAILSNDKNAEQLRTAIDQSEIKHLASLIKQNPEKQREVKRMFGIDMKIPASLDASKKAKGFLWLSNNASSGMQNLLFMRVRRNAGKDGMQLQVDSILHKNMLGETDSMYMTIPHLTERGLWEMKGDAMGGPYIMEQKGDIIVIAFVYAPEKKKRNLTKQLEAVLTTIK